MSNVLLVLQLVFFSATSVFAQQTESPRPSYHLSVKTVFKDAQRTRKKCAPASVYSSSAYRNFDLHQYLTRPRYSPGISSLWGNISDIIKNYQIACHKMNLTKEFISLTQLNQLPKKYPQAQQFKLTNEVLGLRFKVFESLWVFADIRNSEMVSTDQENCRAVFKIVMVPGQDTIISYFARYSGCGENRERVPGESR